MKIYIKPTLKVKDCHYKYFLCAGSGERGAAHGNNGSDPFGNGDWYNEGYGDGTSDGHYGTGDDSEGLGSMSKRGFWDN